MKIRDLAVVLMVCLVAISSTGCKKWFGKKSSTSGAQGSDMVGGPGLLGDGSTLPDRSLTDGKGLVAGQFDTVLFAYDSAQVDDSERAKVEAVSEFLKANASAVATLEGHCDERGSNEYNMSLGERRALAVRAYLMSLGVDGARVQTKSLGEEQPKAAGHDESSWSVNRRVEFVIMK
jgi:peptidoglycan-associated lipoprotein